MSVLYRILSAWGGQREWFLFLGEGEFRRLRAASDFLAGQKVTKEPLGGGRNRQKRLRRPCLHAARPLEPPLRGTRTCKVKRNFRRAKSEWPV